MSEATSADHWNGAYAKGATSRSWYQSEATESLDFIASTGASPATSIVDIGGGASVLVDGLLTRGFGDVTVLDLSAEGMNVARARLAERAGAVTWATADVLDWRPGRTFDVWHDRAVLHFLTADAHRITYVERAAELVNVGGFITIGGFAPDGPTSCSGLPVRGASEEELQALFAPHFTPVRTAAVTHTTPAGNHQSFSWLIAQRANA